VLVVAIDDVAQSVKVVELAREHFPQLKVVARARNVQHWYQLRELGVQHVEREILDSSLMTARSVLELMGWEPHRARTLAMRFRRHNVDQLEETLPHRQDREKVISMAKAGRQQLEELFAQDRADRAERRREGWGE
jgi:glutathione-regulated potassium-efflux system ancillary protein KefC